MSRPVSGNALTSTERSRKRRERIRALRQAVRDRAAQVLDDQRVSLFYGPAASLAKSAADETIISQEIAVLLAEIRTGTQIS